MKRKCAISTFVVFAFILVFSSLAHSKGEWWKKWPSYPKNVPRITATQVKALMLSGEKVIFVYSGYKVKKIICGSVIIPYTLVPPVSDGSRVKIRIPKDYWIMCY